MLNMAMYGASHRALPGDSAYRCRYCSSGPVIGGDGFLMDHCMNCGSWQNYSEPIGPRLSSVKKAVVAWLKKVKAYLPRSSRANAEIAAAPATST